MSYNVNVLFHFDTFKDIMSLHSAVCTSLHNKSKWNEFKLVLMGSVSLLQI